MSAWWQCPGPGDFEPDDDWGDEDYEDEDDCEPDDPPGDWDHPYYDGT